MKSSFFCLQKSKREKGSKSFTEGMNAEIERDNEYDPKRHDEKEH